MEHKSTMTTDNDRFVTPTVAFSGPLGFGKYKNYKSVSVRVPVLGDSSAVNIHTAPRAHRFNYPATDPDYPADAYAAQGIILEFDMDDADGTTITDNVQGLVLTEAGDPAFQTSAAVAGLGNGIVLDGTADAFAYTLSSAAIAAAYTLPDTGDFSVEVVFKTATDTTAAGDTIFCCRDGAAGVGWSLVFDDADHVDFHIEDSSGETALAGTVDVDTGSIVHACVTLDRDGNGIIYTDGTAQGTAAVSARALTLINTSADTKISIGRDAADGGDAPITVYFVRVYNKVLTAAEVLDNCRVLLNQGGSGWSPLADPTDGDDLAVCKAGSDPNEFDLTEYMVLNQVAFRAACAVEQTTSATALDFTWNFRE